MSTQAVAGPTDALIAQFCDSQTKRPFVDAQSVNCKAQHAFSKATVLERYGKMLGNGLCEHHGPCFLCADIVSAYEPIPALQRVVDAFFGEFPLPDVKPAYPLASSTIFWDSAPDMKKPIRLQASTHFYLGDRLTNEIAFGMSGKKKPADTSRITQVHVEISGRTHPDVFITMDVHNATLELRKKVVAFYHAHGVSTIGQLENSHSVGTGDTPMTVVEFERFIEVFQATNKCEESVQSKFDEELRRFKKSK